MTALRMQCVCPLCDAVSMASDLTAAQTAALDRGGPVCWSCGSERMLQVWTAARVSPVILDIEPESYA